jgi:hypothetical protein
MMMRVRCEPQGVSDLNLKNDKDRERRRKLDHSTVTELTDKPRAKKSRSDDPEVGRALRTVYQRTIEEDIPPEMLDLLGKLG